MMGNEEWNNSAVLSADKNGEVSHAEGKTAIETTMRYVEQQENHLQLISYFKRSGVISH